MKSKYCQWLNDLSAEAAKENIIIEAKYHDGLNLFFKSKISLTEALSLYSKMVNRIIAIKFANDVEIIKSRITTLSVRYTPSYPGAEPVKRSHGFNTKEEAADFLTRMKRLYPDTVQL